MIAMKQFFLLLALLMISNISGHSIDSQEQSRMLMTESTSGKGSSGKGSSGKGSGKGKSSKKSSKKSGGKGSNKSPVPATPSPTSENSYAVRPPPYALSYSFGETVADPSPEDFEELADVTRLFLETYMVNRFDQTSIILLDDFLTFMTRYDAGSRPVIAAYRSSARFNPTSIFYPPRAEIEDEIELAFSGDSLIMYIKRLKELPKANAFSQVTDVTFGEPEDVLAGIVTAETVESAGVAAAAAGAALLSVGIVLMARQEKSKAVDARVKHSRSAEKGYRDSVDDEDELQDEPMY